MTRVMENLTGVAVVAVMAMGALGAAEGRAAPFRFVSDGPESVWVLDAASGALNWCRGRAASGPKVIDVFGFDVQAREAQPRASEPYCSLAPGTMSAEARTLAAAGASVHGLFPAFGARVGYGGGYGAGGYGAGGYGSGWRMDSGLALDVGYGDIGLHDGGKTQINILQPENVDIDID
jgi:hypothetical protein